MNYFLKNLTFLTKTTSINQNQLALKLGITRQSVTSMLKTKDPRISTVIKVSEIYNIDINTLLFKDLSKEGE